MNLNRLPDYIDLMRAYQGAPCRRFLPSRINHPARELFQIVH